MSWILGLQHQMSKLTFLSKLTQNVNSSPRLEFIFWERMVFLNFLTEKYFGGE